MQGGWGKSQTLRVGHQIHLCAQMVTAVRLAVAVALLFTTGVHRCVDSRPSIGGP